MRKNKITILDVAKLANVGKSTVSRVITDHTSVKKSTKEKVLKAINELGFTPSKAARSLRGKMEKLIGIIVSRLDSPSETRVVSSILNQATKLGFEVVVMESKFQNQKVKEHLRVLKERND